MQIITGILCIIVFLYFLFILSKDEFMFLKKNFSLDQVFDLGFVGIFWGLLSASIYSFIFDYYKGQLLLFDIIFPAGSGYSMTGIIFGCLIAFYVLIKRKKLAIRVLDYLSVSLLSTLPVWYAGSIFYLKNNALFFNLATGFLCLFVLIFFWRFLLFKRSTNKLRDGSITGLFVWFFTLIAFFDFKTIENFGINVFSKNLLLIFVFLYISVWVVLREFRFSIRNRR